MTPGKADRLQNACTKLLQAKSPTIQHAAEVARILVASFPAVPLGRVFYRQLEIDKATALKFHKGDFNATMQLSPRSKTDLRWFMANIHDSASPVTLVMMISKFNGTSTPKGSYRATTCVNCPMRLTSL